MSSVVIKFFSLNIKIIKGKILNIDVEVNKYRSSYVLCIHKGDNYYVIIIVVCGSYT
jgi:hypothetical protein